MKGISLKSIPIAGWIFVLVLLLRLVVLVRLSGSPFLLPSHGDTHFYNEWALRILHGEWTDHRAFYGLPLYAYLLAAIYKVFGYNPFLPGLIQACLDAGTAVVIYQIALATFRSEGSQFRENSPAHWTGRRAELIGGGAALGWALFQPAAAYSVILMPTSWLVFIFWLVVLEIVKRSTAPRLRGWFCLGLLIGFAAMGIATILFLLPLLLVALFTRWRRPINDGRRWAAQFSAAAALFVGVGLGTSPSWIHNCFVARDPVFLSAHSGVNFWIGNNPMATGYPRLPPGLPAGQQAMLQDSIHIAEAAAGHPLRRSEVSRYWSDQASAYIRHNFGAWLKLLGLKIVNFCSAFQYDDLSLISTLREEGVLFPGLRFGIVAALGLPGMLLAWKRFPLSRWIAAAILLHLVSLLSVFVTERYRLAAVPGLLLLAAFGMWELWYAGATVNYRRAGTYLGLLALSTWFVSIPKREPTLWALDAYNSGRQALETGDLARAEGRLQLARAYVPDNVETNFALANLRLAQGNIAAAKALYLIALESAPTHIGALNNLGVVALQEHQGATAVGYFRQACAQEPSNAKAHFLLAKGLLSTGDKMAAVIEVNRAIALNPAQPEFLALRNEMNNAPR